MPSALTPKLGVTKCAQTHPCDRSGCAEITRTKILIKAAGSDRTRREIEGLVMTIYVNSCPNYPFGLDAARQEQSRYLSVG
jgi:hypothetical protein